MSFFPVKPRKPNPLPVMTHMVPVLMSETDILSLLNTLKQAGCATAHESKGSHDSHHTSSHRQRRALSFLV